MASLSDLIPVVNKLQDIVTTTQLADLDLPLLAVVGSQLSGKLSVLENIVGKDFLPRGTGIVTRRPLVLQLINIHPGTPHFALYAQQQAEAREDEPKQAASPDDGPTLEDHLRKHVASTNGLSAGSSPSPRSASSGDDFQEVDLASGGAYLTPATNTDSPVVEWGEFLHVPGKKFFNFNDIRTEIENETARIAGKNKGISRLPINLKVYSTQVLNLTLVDLPGLTKIPIGDQPTDIERQTRNLILEYISKPNCIILAVLPANVDLVNLEALKLARQVDPQGKRTVGLLTKLDLMDQGTNAVDILSGKVYPLKLGFVGIVNRLQQDIALGKPMQQLLADEEQFFLSNPAYAKIASHCGTRYLCRTLNNILMAHIREKLPDIKAKLNTLVGLTEQELRLYGEDLVYGADSATKGLLILLLMNRFANNFVHLIDGQDQVLTTELCGGARIYYVYTDVFGRLLHLINPVANLLLENIRTAIRNSTGPRPLLFVPELAFDLLVKPQIRLLELPLKRVVELVYEELMKIAHNNCGTAELQRYPKLHAKLIEVTSDLLRERLGPTTKYVELMIEIHRAYINTNHPNFIGAPQAMQQVVEERRRLQKHGAGRGSTHPPIAGATGVPGGSSAAAASAAVSAATSHRKLAAEDEVAVELAANAESSTAPPPVATNGDGAGANHHRRAPSTVPDAKEKDSFLHYFFGKESGGNGAPAATNGELQAQTSLSAHPASATADNYKPFEFPTEADALQFRDPNDVNIGALDLGNLGSASVMLEEPLLEREELECELIRRLILLYFSIVREMIQDQVPKATMCLLVNYSRDEIQNRLVQKLYDVSRFDELLMEDATLMRERSRLVKLLDSYRDAMEVIGDVV